MYCWLMEELFLFPKTSVLPLGGRSEHVPVKRKSVISRATAEWMLPFVGPRVIATRKTGGIRDHLR